MWTEAGAQMKLEESLGIGGFGYPVSGEFKRFHFNRFNMRGSKMLIT